MIYRGYYTARRYEFYFPVVKTIFYERAQQVSKIFFLTGENKIHIIVLKPPCMVLYTDKSIARHFSLTVCTNNRENREIVSLISLIVRIWKLRQSGPGYSFDEFFEW